MTSRESAIVHVKVPFKMNVCHAVIFSRDRASFLKILLSSMSVFLDFRISASIIWRSERRSRSEYLELSATYPSMHFFEQVEQDDVRPSLSRVFDITSVSLIMFLVDDALLCGPLYLEEATSILLTRCDVSGFQFRLSPSVQYSCNRMSSCMPPSLERISDNFFAVDTSSPVLEWNYPFDISSGLYRRELIHSILDLCSLESSSKSFGPNRFELVGNRVLHQGVIIAGPLVRCMVVHNIDRVQSEFANPTSNIPISMTSSTLVDHDAYLASSSFAAHAAMLCLGKSIEPSGVLVSVILPVYNMSEFVVECIKSVMMQSYRNFECIIVDDGSTDSSFALASDACAGDPRFRIVSHSRNMGIVGALHTALASVNPSAGLIARMDADDVMHPDRLRRQVLFLNANPSVVICHSSASVGNHHRSEIVVQPMASIAALWTCIFHCPVAHPTVCARSWFFRMYPYRSGCDGFEDFDVWTRVLLSDFKKREFSFGALGDVLLHHRVHATSTTSRFGAMQRFHSRVLVQELLRKTIEEHVDLTVVEALSSSPSSKSCELIEKAIDVIAKWYQVLSKFPISFEDHAYLKEDYRGRVAALLHEASVADPDFGSHWVRHALCLPEGSDILKLLTTGR